MKKKIIGISMAVLGFGAVAALNFGIAVDRNNLSGSLSLDNVEALAAELKKPVHCYVTLIGVVPGYEGEEEAILCPANYIMPVIDDCPKSVKPLFITDNERLPGNKGDCMKDSK